MGRRRTKHTHLPPRMVAKHGAFYHVRTDGQTASGKPRKVWRHLGRDYGTALREWAAIEGQAPAQSLTIAAMLADYLRHCGSRANRAADETLRGYAQSAKRLGAVFGHMRPEDLRREHVYRYVVELGRVAANRDRALLGAAWSHAANLGSVTAPNPAHGLRYRVPEPPRRRYVTDAELERLVAVAPPHLGRAIRLAYLTGLREGDLVRVRVRDAGPEGIAWRASKTGAAGIVAWSEELRATWREIARDRIGDQPALLTSRGTAWTTSGLRASWRRVKLAAGLADVQWHDLRRKSGADSESDQAAAELLGHADAAVTRRHYRPRVKPAKPPR